MNLSKKIALSVAVGFFSNFAFAQTLQDGVDNADSHKYAKAKEVFTQMIAKSPTAENYFYLGNSYLTQFEPNFDLAQENFNKGLALDPKSFLNKIGLASIKLGKGDKTAIVEIQKIVIDSKEKDPEKIEKDLLKLLPKDYLGSVNHLFVWHGRNTCIARKPKCESCTIKNYCESYNKTKHS